MTDMTEVIAAHFPDAFHEAPEDEPDTAWCSCGAELEALGKATELYAAHVADELTKAGYGNVQEAKAEAWDEAYSTGVDDHRISLEYSSDDFGIPGGRAVTPARNNPYRKDRA